MVRNLPELLVPPDNILVAAATLFLQLSQAGQVLAALATCNVGNRQGHWGYLSHKHDTRGGGGGA